MRKLLLIASIMCACGRGQSPVPRPFTAEPPVEPETERVGAALYSIDSFTVTIDGERVVYNGRVADGEPRAVYAARLDGSDPVLLSPAGLDGYQLQASPDGNHIVYLARDTSIATWSLYAAAIDGGVPVELSSPAETSFVITADSERVVFRADAPPNNERLYVVPVTGGAVTDITPTTMADEGRAYGVQLLPANVNTVLCTYRPTSTGRTALAAVDLITGSSVALDGGGGGRGVGSAVPSSDGTRVVYRHDRSGDFELFVVNIDGTARTRLDQSAGDVQGITLAADDDTVVFTARTQDGYRLFATTLTTPALVELAARVDPWQYLAIGAVTADAAHVVYAVIDDRQAVTELFSVPTSGGTPVRLNGPMGPGGTVGDVYSFISLLQVDGQRVLYRSTESAPNHMELFGVDVTGENHVRINPDLPPGGNIGQVAFASGPERIVYQGGVEVGWKQELMLWRAGTTTRLSHPLAATADVERFSITANGDRAVFQVSDMDGSSLFVTSIDGR